MLVIVRCMLQALRRAPPRASATADQVNSPVHASQRGRRAGLLPAFMQPEPGPASLSRPLPMWIFSYRLPRDAMPSGSTNQMNVIHKAKMISVPPIIITLLPGRLPAMRVLHAASRGAQRQVGAAFSADFRKRIMKPRPARSRPGYPPGCRRPV